MIWGSNGAGQCNVPPSNSDIVAIAAAQEDCLALRTDGSIGGYGYGFGFANGVDVPAPNTDFLGLAVGAGHYVALKSDGSIVAWGAQNNYGQCDVPAPNADFVAVAAGLHHSLGLKSDGSIVAWGWNTSGQCNVPAPNQDFVALAGGEHHSLGLKSDGTVVAWGGYSRPYGVPTPNADFVAIDAGAYFSLGLKSDGSIAVWGSAGTSEWEVPAPNADFVAIAAGWSHGLGLKSNGSIVAWGRNDYGQCNIPTPNAGFLAIAAGREFSAGLKTTVPSVVLQGHESRWAQDHVTIVWNLIDMVGDLTFDIARRQRAGDAYDPIPRAYVQRHANEFVFDDHTAEPGVTYEYSVVIYEDGQAVTSFETSVTTPVAMFSLDQNHPNPFNPTTTIAFSLQRADRVTLVVYSPTGTRVATLLDRQMTRGSHAVQWDGRNANGQRLASGVYFYRLATGTGALTRKMILLK